MLAAALRLIDREGLQALTMRRLGRELGVEAMSLYNHVRGKEDLLDGVVELLAREVEIPSVGSWDDRLREVVRGYRGLARLHPNAFPLIALRPLNTRGSLEPIEATLTIACSAGFDVEASMLAVRVLASYASGYALSELNGFGLEGEAGALDAQALPADSFPLLRALAPQLRSQNHDVEFERGLELIMTALRASADPREAR